MRLLSVLYALSGCIALGYQVAWFRFFVDAFGSRNITFAFVLVQFLGGLGAGGLASRRVSAWVAHLARTRDPLRIYGMVELTQALAAAATLLVPHLPAGGGGAFPYLLVGGVHQPTAGVQWLLFGASLVGVFLPCFLMGVGFPLLCHAFQGDSRLPARLYAWNTLGAASGILISEFALLPWLGHGVMHAALVASNLGLGLIFALGRVRAPVADGPPAPGTPAHRSPPDDAPVAQCFALAIGAGLLTGAFEADVLRRLQFFDCRTGAALACVSFWAIVAIFLASTVVARAPHLRLGLLQGGVVLALGIYYTAWQLGYPLRDWANQADAERVRAALPALPPGLSIDYQFFHFGYSHGSLLWFTGLFVLPPLFLLSLLLPWACNRMHERGRHLGALYGANTLAFCLGLVAFTVVAPHGNQFYAMRLFFGVFAAGVLFLCTLGLKPRAMLGSAAVGLAAVGVLGGVTSAEFAPGWFPAGSAAAVHPVRALRSDGAHTTFVVAEPEGDVLWFDSHRMTGVNHVAQQYMRLMAHLPLLAHPGPRQALLICFGAGMTASAIAAHGTITQLDIVDLNDQVFATAPEFARTNRNVIADPRVRLVHDDGRHFLRGTDQRYDFITSEPPPPLFPGVDRLYSLEYYQDARRRLTPGGLMSQWLPIDQMPLPALRAAIAAFVQVFPDCVLFVGASTNYVIVGSHGPLHLPNVESRFAAEAAVRSDLLAFDIRSPRDLLARITQSAPELRRDFGDFAPVRDQHNVFAHVYHDPRTPPVLTYDPVAMLAGLGAAGGDQLACRKQLEHVVLHLGRLKSLVADFPEAALTSVRTRSTGPVAMAKVDWILVQLRIDAFFRAASAGRHDEALGQLGQALALAPQFTAAARQLGMLLLQKRQHAAALEAWRSVVAADEHDLEGHAGVVLCLLETGQRDAAMQRARAMVENFPEAAAAHRLQGDAHTAFGQWADALRCYETALRLAPGDQAAMAGRARCLEQVRR